MSLSQPFSGDQTTDERLATKDVKAIQLLNTHYTVSQWMEVLKMKSVALKLATQYSVQKPALAALICTILGETHLVTNGFTKTIVLDERGLELYEGNGDILGQMITLYRLGSCHKSLGNYKQAIVCYKNVRKIYVNYVTRPIQQPLGEDFMEIVLTNLRKCYINVGQNYKAIETHKRCWKLTTERKDSGKLAMAKFCETQDFGGRRKTWVRVYSGWSSRQSAVGLRASYNRRGLQEVEPSVWRGRGELRASTPPHFRAATATYPSLLCLSSFFLSFFFFDKQEWVSQ